MTSFYDEGEYLLHALVNRSLPVFHRIPTPPLTLWTAVEIEDFDYDEELDTFFYACPCGDRFQITRVRPSSASSGLLRLTN